VLLAVLALLGIGVSQAQNWEALQRLLGRRRKASESPPTPRTIHTSAPSSPVIAGSNLNSAGDLVIGDQVGGVKVMGDQHIHPAPKPRPELPTSHTPHNLPELTTAPDRFVGRKAQLDKLSQRLEPPGSRVLLTGMGGVGKSELALQHAYAQLEHYRGGIVRLDARQGYEGMAAEVLSFVRGHFPDLLPDKGPPEELLPLCWSQWPSAESTKELVLLLLDDLPCDGTGEESARRLCKGLPPRFRRLITRREKAPPGVASIDLEVLERPDSMLLLRLQAEGHADGRGRVEAEADAADSLCQEVGDLPLALVLLGTRLAQQPDLRIANLLEDLKAKGAEASALRDSHPELGARQGMVESLLISWEPLSASAKELAVLLSLMAPAVIPWELVEACRREEQELVEGSAFGMAQAELLRSQLLERVGPDRYRLHPLVRSFAALQASQPALAPVRDVWRRQFTEAITTLCSTKFPQVMPLALQAEVEDFVPHIAEVAEHGSDILDDEDMTWPSTALGRLYMNKANFATSLLWLQRGQKLCEQRLGPEHPETASSLNNLAQLLKATNQLAEAEPLMKSALAIMEASYGPDHPNVAACLNNLAQLLKGTNRLAEAEPLMKRALAINEASYGPDHPRVATDLNNLAQLLKATNQLAEAEPLMKSALAITEASYGPDHPNVAACLNNLAQLLQATNRLAEAEPLMKRALAITEASYGPDHPLVATSLNNLASLLQVTNRLAEAEPLMKRALAIDEASYGPDHPEVATDLNNVAHLLKATNRLPEAELLMKRALAILFAFSKQGHEHPHLQAVFRNYISFLQSMGLSEVAIQDTLNTLRSADASLPTESKLGSS
jgi:tetratricopeptide (TPR) repeat protein